MARRSDYSRRVTQIDRYIFRHLFLATASVAVILTCVIWLTQSLRFIEMIINRGLSAPLFAYFTLLLLPTFLGVILPVSLFAAVLFTYNRLVTDSELVVLRAAGMSQFALGKPALLLGLLVTLIGYSLTLYLIPASFREFKDLQYMLRNSYSTVLLQEGVFNTIMKGVTVYVRRRTSEGELLGIIIHDDRVPGKPVTMMAEQGAIVTGENGPRVVMGRGNRQEISDRDRQLSLLYFDRYSFDIGAVGESPGQRWREPRERFLPELFYPMDQEKTVWAFHKLRMEGHYRLAQPPMAFAIVLIGLAFLLAGDFNRRGQLRRVMAAVAVVLAMEITLLGIKNLGEQAPWLTPLIYLTTIVPAILGALMMSSWRRSPRRHGLPDTPVGRT